MTWLRFTVALGGVLTVMTELICASSGTHIAPAISVAVQELQNLILIITLTDQSLVACSHSSVTIDDKRCRQRFDSTVEVADTIVSKGHAVIDFLLFEVRLHGIPAILIHGDAEHGKAAVLILLL